MEPPAKRQKLSQDFSLATPTRTLNLASFQRPVYKKRNAGRVILPRVPDVTLTASVVEVAVNDGTSITEIAAATSDATITLSSLGTLTIPAVEVSVSANDSSSSPTPQDTPGSLSSTLTSNSTETSTDRTVMVTATSTFRVSYTNGTFIMPATTNRAHTDKSSSAEETSSDSETTPSYTFGQDFTDSFTESASSTSPVYQNTNVAATITQSTSSPTSTSDHHDSGPVLTPKQTQMVGGIVGGLAGIAFVLFAILYFLRWYRQRLKLQGRLPQQLTSSSNKEFGNGGLIGMAAPMSLSSRSSFFTQPPSISSPRNMRRLDSDETTATASTTATGPEPERRFERVSGRKIASVLTTGGDQFGGSYGVFEKEIGSPITASRSAGAMGSSHHREPSDSSIYVDEEISNSGPLSRSAPTSPVYPSIFAAKSPPNRHPGPITPSTPGRAFSPDCFDTAFYRNVSAISPRPDGFAISRNSPARTPVIQSPSMNSLRLPSQAPVTMDEDIPEMPLPSPGLGLGYEMTAARQRVPSRLK